MYKSVFIIIILNIVSLSVHAQNDTIWFDKKWKKTTNENAHFYRPKPIKKDSLFIVKDFYITGELQMKGRSKYANKDYFQGTVHWYDKAGKVTIKRNYINNKISGNVEVDFNGKMVKALYKNGALIEGDIVCPAYSDESKYIVRYKNKKIAESNYYFKNNKVKKQLFYDEKGYHHKTLFYNKKGKIIGQYIKDETNYSGENISYYDTSENIKSISYYKEGKVIYSDIYYPNGNPLVLSTKTKNEIKTSFFDANQKVISNMVYTESDNTYNPYQPFQGTQIHFYPLDKETDTIFIEEKITYNKGVKTQEKLFYKNGKLKIIMLYDEQKKRIKQEISFTKTGDTLSVLTYKNYTPYQGIKLTNNSKTWYNEGKISKEIKYNRNTGALFSEKENDKITYYDTNGKVMGTLELTPFLSYEKPLNGNMYRSINNSEKYNVISYKDGMRVSETSWQKSYTNHHYFKKVIIYLNDIKHKETEYYSNQKKQTEITYKSDGYTKDKGTFYDQEENLLSTYDFLYQNGTKYEFFSESDYIKKIETLDKGYINKYKEYYLDYRNNSEKENSPVLVCDVDLATKAVFYNKLGEVMYTTTFKDKKPFNGVMFNPQTYEAFTYVNGVKEGVYKKHKYNFSDQIKASGNYTNDKRHGIFSYYDYYGNLSKTVNYKEDALEGNTIYYETDGTIKTKISYKNDAPFQGTITYKYSTITYEKGEKASEIKFYDDGDIHINYSREKKYTTIHYPNSKLKKYSFSTNTNDYIDGEVLRYNKKGKTMHRAILKNGKLESGELWLKVNNTYDYPKAIYTILKKEGNWTSALLKNKEEKTLFEAKENMGKHSIIERKLSIMNSGIRYDDLY